MSIGPLWVNFSEISIKIWSFPFMKIHLNIPSAKCRPFCPGGEMSKRRTTKKIPSHYWMSVQRGLIFSDPMNSPQRCQWYFIIPSCKYSALLKSYGIFLQRTQSSPCCLFGVHNLSEISSFVHPGTWPCYIRPRYIKSLKYRHNPHKFYISEIYSNPWPTYQHCGILPY